MDKHENYNRKRKVDNTPTKKKYLQNIDKGRKIHAKSKIETCLIKPNISMQLNHLPLRIRVGLYK